MQLWKPNWKWQIPYMETMNMPFISTNAYLFRQKCYNNYFLKSPFLASKTLVNSSVQPFPAGENGLLFKFLPNESSKVKFIGIGFKSLKWIYEFRVIIAQISSILNIPNIRFSFLNLANKRCINFLSRSRWSLLIIITIISFCRLHFAMAKNAHFYFFNLNWFNVSYFMKTNILTFNLQNYKYILRSEFFSSYNDKCM